eukprot:scaffold251374_cov23-Tisochrysis_lutea.AAC.1
MLQKKSQGLVLGCRKPTTAHSHAVCAARNWFPFCPHAAQHADAEQAALPAFGAKVVFSSLPAILAALGKALSLCFQHICLKQSQEDLKDPGCLLCARHWHGVFTLAPSSSCTLPSTAVEAL